MTASLLSREEYEPIRIDGPGEGLTGRQLKRLVATWRATTGRDPGGAFQYGPGFVKPTNWAGSVAAGEVVVEVVPRGARSLDQAGRDRLDENLGQMLHLALSKEALNLGIGEVNPRGSRFDRAVEALCDLVARARRKRVLRRYRVREEVTRPARGQLCFPAQSAVAVRHPGFAACRWVELDEDNPENRFLKAALAFARRRVNGPLRRQVDEALIMFELAAEPPNPSLEYGLIQFGRLPEEYVEAVELAHGILEGGAVGIFAGTRSSRSEVLFLPDLFQDFTGRLVQQFARDRELAARLELRGRLLSRWGSGLFAGAESIEFVPDAELVDPPSPTPLAIIDAKWKVLRPGSPGLGITASDVHQMVAYATRLGCQRTALVYPWLGAAPPPQIEEPPIMEVGTSPDAVKIAVVCIPLLWRSVEEPVARVAAGLDRLLIS